MNKLAVLASVVCCWGVGNAYAALSFGSRQSAFEAGNGSINFANTATTLNKGTLRTIGSGSITADAGEYLTCSQVKIEHKGAASTKSMRIDGQLYLNDDTLSLSNNQVLTVNGGQVGQAVTVSAAQAAPAIIQGTGSFASGINVDATAAATQLNIRWQGELNQNITLTNDDNTTVLRLEDHLAFARGKGVTVTSSSNTARIECGGYNLTLGGTPDAPITFGGKVHQWDRAKIILTGDVELTANVTISDVYGTGDDDLFINGNNHTLNMNGGVFVTSTKKVYLTNLNIENYGSGLVSASGGNIFVENATFDNGIARLKMRQGHIAAQYDDIFGTGEVRFSSADLDLLSDFTVQGHFRFSVFSSDFGGSINGHGRSLCFADSSARLRYKNGFILQDIRLVGVGQNSFYCNSSADQNLYLSNVSWHDSTDGAIHITPSSMAGNAASVQLQLPVNSLAGDIFRQNVTWATGAQITLLSEASLQSTWTFSASYPSVFEGQGQVLNVGSGTITFNDDLYLSNMVLADVVSTSLSRAASKYIYANNLTWVDGTGQGAIRINANGDTAGTISAAKILVHDTNDGDLFGNPITWDNGAHIELLSDITLGDVWTFSENSTIIGDGHVIDLNSVAGALTIAEGKTLTLRDVVIKGWGTSGSIVFGNNNANLSLSNVTIIMSGDVTLAANELLNIKGPVTFITGAGIFDATSGGASHTWSSGTILYDVGSTIGTAPKVLFDAAANIEVGMIARTLYDYSVGDDGQTAPALHMESSLFLDKDIDTDSDGTFEARGRQLTIYNSSAVTVRGNGRTIYLGGVPASGDTLATSQKLITVSGSASNIVEIKDLCFDGWNQSHISDANSLIRYCDGTIIRLKENQTLTASLDVAYNSFDTVVIDLNGHDIDFSSNNAAINIANTAAQVTIRNGRLINISDDTGNESKLLPAGTTSTLTLQDVELVLNDDLTLKRHNVVFAGDCKVTGTSSYELKCKGTQITIASGACLHIDTRMTLGLYTSTVDPTLSFGSRNATLFLNGATFDASSVSIGNPTFTTGTIRVDGMCTFIGDMTLGSATASLALDLDLMPAANMRIQSGAITYANGS